MKNKKPPKIKYFDLWGLREEKYKFLETHDITNTKWQELEPKAPYFWFVPKNLGLSEEYKRFIASNQIFTKYNRCVVTSRDDFVIAQQIETLKRKIRLFFNPRESDKDIKGFLGLKDGKKWKISDVRKKTFKRGIDESLFVDYLYRPFDKRFIYYENNLLERSRKEIMKNMLQPDIGLLLMRQVYWSKPYSHFLVTDCITDSRIFISNRGAADIFPLYLYSDKKAVFRRQKYLDISGVQKQSDENRTKQSNIKTEVIQKLSGVYQKQVSPEGIFYYIYGVLYSNIYRQKYNEFLKIDFPRVPFTKNRVLFFRIAELGRELTVLHLLKSPKLEKVLAKFPVSTGNILTDCQVAKREYKPAEKRVYVNQMQYFEGVEPEIWNYYIGGYQVLDKWLKDRVGTKLSPEDVSHYLKIITALKHTIALQAAIDRIYPEVEKNLVSLN